MNESIKSIEKAIKECAANASGPAWGERDAAFLADLSSSYKDLVLARLLEQIRLGKVAISKKNVDETDWVAQVVT